MEEKVPIWEKSNLTLEEAAAYSGIGINKLRIKKWCEKVEMFIKKSYNKNVHRDRVYIFYEYAIIDVY